MGVFLLSKYTFQTGAVKFLNENGILMSLSMLGTSRKGNDLRWINFLQIVPGSCLCPFSHRFYQKGHLLGRAVAQAVRRWLPTAAARVRVQAACGVCGGQSGTGAGVFSEYFGFPCQISTPNFSIIIITRGWHDRSIGGPSAEWTQLDSTPHYTNLKKKGHLL
jgi:hypothetical protein